MVKDGRLRHSWRQGVLAHPATLEDHAALIAAALALHESAGDPEALADAEAWATQVEEHFADPDGGYFLAADDVDDIVLRPKTAYDNATPSGNGLMVHGLARLFFLTGNPDYRDRADALITAFSGLLEKNAMAIPMLITGNALLQEGLQIVLAGDDEAALDALHHAALAAGNPAVVIQRVADGAALPATHPAHGKGPAGGKPAAYVCRGTTCSLPLTDPAALTDAVRAMGRAA
jgi:uncharacterized protein YyaL (SSP411 family)